MFIWNPYSNFEKLHCQEVERAIQGILPCKIGDTVYTIWMEALPRNPEGKLSKTIVSTKVTMFQYARDGLSIVVDYCNASFHISTLGKSIFLNRKDAVREVIDK